MTLSAAEWDQVSAAVQKVEILNINALSRYTGITHYKLRTALREPRNAHMICPLILRQIEARNHRKKRAQLAISLRKDAGFTWEKIGKIFGVSRQRALQLAQQYDTENVLNIDQKAQRARSAEKKVEVFKLLAEGVKPREIAERCETPLGTVTRWISEEKRRKAAS